MRHGLHTAAWGGKVLGEKLLSCMTVFIRPHAWIQTPLCGTLALHLTRITLVCIGKVVYVCGCMCACFARRITSCVSLTGPVPRRPPRHATLLLLRPTGSDTCEMLTWLVAAPSPGHQDAALLVTLTPSFSLAGSFFFCFGLRSPFNSVPLFFPVLFSPEMIKEIAAHFPGQWAGL